MQVTCDWYHVSHTWTKSQMTKSREPLWWGGPFCSTQSCHFWVLLLHHAKRLQFCLILYLMQMNWSSLEEIHFTIYDCFSLKFIYIWYPSVSLPIYKPKLNCKYSLVLVKSRVYRFCQIVRAYFNLREFRKWFPTFLAKFDRDAPIHQIVNTPIYMLAPLSYSLTHTTFTKTTVSAIIWNNAARNVSWHNTEMSHACSCDSKSGFISITLLLLLWQSIWITARR